LIYIFNMFHLFLKLKFYKYYLFTVDTRIYSF